MASRAGRRTHRKGDDVARAQRNRRRYQRRQRLRRMLTWRRVVSLLALVLLVGAAVWAVFFSSWLSVQQVSVTGATGSDDGVTSAQVLAAARVDTGGPLATVDLSAAQHRVAALAPVASVEVTRQWPHTVHITVVERTPVAAIGVGGTYRGLDASGVVFGSFARRPAGLPVVQASAAADTTALQQAALVVAALPTSLRVLTDHVSLVSADDIELALTDDRTVQWGSAADSTDKAAVLVTLLQRDARFYDVSVPGAPTTSNTPPR